MTRYDRELWTRYHCGNPHAPPIQHYLEMPLFEYRLSDSRIAALISSSRKISQPA